MSEKMSEKMTKKTDQKRREKMTKKTDQKRREIRTRLTAQFLGAHLTSPEGALVDFNDKKAEDQVFRQIKKLVDRILLEVYDN